MRFCLVLLLAAVATTTTFVEGNLLNRSRVVSFWYAPSEADLNQTIQVLSNHSDAVSSVMLYCGHGVNNDGTFVNKVSSICSGPTGVVERLRALNIEVEFVVNDLCTNVTAHKMWFENENTIDTLVNIAKEYGLSGWNLDLEPQKVPGTADDAKPYASFCANLRTELNKVGTRLTIDVAQWSPMLRQYDVLAPTVDRMMNMETYNADSFDGWLNGDAYGGFYTAFVNSGIPRRANGVGLGCWPTAGCEGANHDWPCWTTTPPSGEPRMKRIAQDGVPEVALFRLYGDQSEKTPPNSRWPEDFWWPLLHDFLFNATHGA
eukprot:g4041.t1